MVSLRPSYKTELHASKKCFNKKNQKQSINSRKKFLLGEGLHRSPWNFVKLLLSPGQRGWYLSPMHMSGDLTSHLLLQGTCRCTRCHLWLESCSSLMPSRRSQTVEFCYGVWNCCVFVWLILLCIIEGELTLMYWRLKNLIYDQGIIILPTSLQLCSNIYFKRKLSFKINDIRMLHKRRVNFLKDVTHIRCIWN